MKVAIFVSRHPPKIASSSTQKVQPYLRMEIYLQSILSKILYLWRKNCPDITIFNICLGLGVFQGGHWLLFRMARAAKKEKRILVNSGKNGHVWFTHLPSVIWSAWRQLKTTLPMKNSSHTPGLDILLHNDVCKCLRQQLSTMLITPTCDCFCLKMEPSSVSVFNLMMLENSISSQIDKQGNFSVHLQHANFASPRISPHSHFSSCKQ